jgi:DNA topoisomerase III
MRESCTSGSVRGARGNSRPYRNHYEYRGQLMRVLFTAQDSQTIRDAFGRAKPNAEYARLYAAAVARRQADQIYNLSLTRTATVILGRGARRVIGVGRDALPPLIIEPNHARR